MRTIIERVVERETGLTYVAQKTEGGYIIFAKSGDVYKKLKESTFKRYFRSKKEEDEPEQEAPQPKKAEEPKKVEKPEEPKTAKKPETKKVAKAEAKVNLQEEDPEKYEQLIDKIRKVLALSKNNPSQEEAISAALMAQKLMAKYNIKEEDLLEEITDDNIDSVVSEQKHNSNLHAWRKALANIVGKNFRCKTYINGNQDVVFRGFTQDARIAMEVYTSLYAVGDSLGSKHYHKALLDTGSGKGIYASFVTGFLKGIEDALNEQCTALMIIVPKAVETEWEEFSKGFKTSRTTLRISDSHAYHAGVTEGKNAIKARGIEAK